MKNEIVQINADKISKMTGYSPEEVAVVKNSVAKGVTDTELAFFLNVCKSVNLNPFVKEIWCYKDHKQNLLVFAGRDGHRTFAQKNNAFNGMRSSEVCEEDSFSLDIAQNEITHKITGIKRGKIIGAYSIIFRKDGEPSIAWAEMDAYDRKFGAWKTHPAAMIKKVAETNALKMAFGMPGIQSEYEYDLKGTTAIPIQPIEEGSGNQIMELRKDVMAILKTLPEEEMEGYLVMLEEKAKANELTEDLLVNLLIQLKDVKEEDSSSKA